MAVPKTVGFQNACTVKAIGISRRSANLTDNELRPITPREEGPPSLTLENLLPGGPYFSEERVLRLPAYGKRRQGQCEIQAPEE